jgi:hypothetical protein
MALSFPPFPPILSRNIFGVVVIRSALPESFFQSSFHSSIFFPYLFLLSRSFLCSSLPYTSFMPFVSFALAHGVREGVLIARHTILMFLLTEMLYSTSIFIIIARKMHLIFNHTIRLDLHRPLPRAVRLSRVKAVIAPQARVRTRAPAKEQSRQERT